MEKALKMIASPQRTKLVNPDSDEFIAEASSGLVDRSRIVEVERLDPQQVRKRTSYLVVKRLFDVVASIVALILLFIPMVVVAIRIKADSPGPVFYVQERLGKDGKPFKLVKFRTMRIDAEADGAQWAMNDDPRVTPFGRRLRRSRFDETPQFWGVIKGDLSIVGPRPERAVFYREFNKYIHGFEQRLMARPGITGLAQVNGGYDLLPEKKIVYDLDYIKRASVSLDLKIMVQTVGVVFGGSSRGAR